MSVRIRAAVAWEAGALLLTGRTLHGTMGGHINPTVFTF
jgi:hypothetical protein